MVSRFGLLLAGSALVVIPACGDDDANVTASVASTDAASDSTEVTESTLAVLADPRVGLKVLHPPGWKLRDLEREHYGDVRDSVGVICEIPQWSLGPVEIEMVPSSCDVEYREPGNGFHGTYRTLADVGDGGPADVEQVDTPVGVAEVFTQHYFECTNECNDYVDRVAIVTLDAPDDPDYPTLVVRSDKDEADLEDFTKLLEDLAEY